jgi:predicted ATP-dependent serine protease
MISLVAGDPGEGKTKNLITMANESVKSSNGNIVYLDADSSHMYSLSHKIRYINTSEFPINDFKEFFGFMCGIISEDNDITQIYIDGLLRLAHLPSIKDADELVAKLNTVANSFNIKLIISITCNNNVIPEFLKEYLVA